MPKPVSGYNRCSTWIGGAGIFIVLASLMLAGSKAYGLSLIYILALVILNFLTYHFPKLRYLIITLTSILAFAFILKGLFGFFSSNLNQSRIGLYDLIIGLYSLGIFICQYQALANKKYNKQINKD